MSSACNSTVPVSAPSPSASSNRPPAVWRLNARTAPTPSSSAASTSARPASDSASGAAALRAPHQVIEYPPEPMSTSCTGPNDPPSASPAATSAASPATISDTGRRGGRAYPGRTCGWGGGNGGRIDG